MADDTQHSDDIGELRGQVRGLQSGFLDLGRKLDEGLGRLTEYIRSTAEKTDQRIDAQALRTDAKFEALAQAQLVQASSKGTNTWPIVGLVVTGVIGIASLGFTFWTLAKAPVDDKFTAMAAAIVGTNNDLREFIKDQREVAKGFVPTAEIKIIEENVIKLGERQFALAIAAAKSDQRVEDNVQTINYLREDLKALNLSTPTKDEITAQNSRITTLSNRIQNLYDKNYATPRQPCLESGAGCGPVTLPGPQVQPSGNSPSSAGH